MAAVVVAVGASESVPYSAAAVAAGHPGIHQCCVVAGRTAKDLIK